MSRDVPGSTNNKVGKDRKAQDREKHEGDHHPESPRYTPRELDPLAHPKEEKGSIERERAPERPPVMSSSGSVWRRVAGPMARISEWRGIYGGRGPNPSHLLIALGLA